MTIERQDTRELIRQALEGDRAAFDALCQASRDEVLGTIRRMIGAAASTHIDPEDVLQDVFATALSSLAEFRWQGPRSFRRWLEGIARHRVLHLSRRESRRGELLQLVRPTTQDPSPSRAAQRQERFERLKDGIGTLPPEYREVLRLARIEGRSIREVAASLGKTESAVKNLLLRAMKKLREVLPETESLTLPKERRIDESSPGDRVKDEDGSDGHGS